VEGFARIAHPLHDLTKKNAAFIWTEACEEAFVELKKRLTSAPVLAAPTDHGQYILDTDASDFALGAVLQQRQDDGLVHVIAYGSRSLSEPERRYFITRKEMLAVVFGLKKYRQHLLGRDITVRTDHAALTYLYRTPEPIGQQGRWLDLLSQSSSPRLSIDQAIDTVTLMPCLADHANGMGARRVHSVLRGPQPEQTHGRDQRCGWAPRENLRIQSLQ